MNRNVITIAVIIVITAIISITVLNGADTADHRDDRDHGHSTASPDTHDDEGEHADEPDGPDAHDHEDEHDHDEHVDSTTIPDAVAAESGIGLSTAGPAVVVDTIELTGTVQAVPSGISEVRARFPGLVRKIYRDIGEEVSAGDVLAVVESNESLRDYEVRAPIAGLIVDRDLQVGQVAADQPLYQIVDLSNVWVQLDALGRSAARVATGQSVRIITLDGHEVDGTIEWLSPLVAHGSQSQRARVPLPNPDRRIRPGQFVRGIVTIASSEVPLAVKLSALQTLDDADVVFEKNATTYSARAVRLGRRDSQHVELLTGLYRGAVYVSENSYLIKADIEKSGATHQH